MDFRKVSPGISLPACTIAAYGGHRLWPIRIEILLGYEDVVYCGDGRGSLYRDSADVAGICANGGRIRLNNRTGLYFDLCT